MQMIVDIDQQPPYVELYSDAPLMCASLVNTRQAMAGSTSLPELVYWCHGVHRVMDKVAGRLGLVKIKALSNDSQTCLFSISPDMPSRQQAEVMLHAAQQLLAALSQMERPDGGQLEVKVTIHAGKYAGAVVGHSAWTYDLFGEDVLLLLDMDRANSPNCIQVSDAALSLINSRPGQFTPVSKVVSEGREVQMHALAQQQPEGSPRSQPLQPAAQLPGGQQDSRPPLAQHDQLSQEVAQMPAVHARAQQQQQQQQQQPELQAQQPPELSAAIAAAQHAVRSTQRQQQRHGPATTSAVAALQSPAAAAAAAAAEEAAAGTVMQPHLTFADPVLESAYVAAQSQPLARMDLLFVLLNLGMTLCCLWDLSTSSTIGDGMSSGSSSAPVGQLLNTWQLLVSAWGQWLLLPVAVVWLLASPSSYGRWRETLWLAHRLLAALHVAGLVLGSTLLAQRGPAGGAAGAGAAAASAAAAIKGTLVLHRGKALTLFAEQLGLKVRFRVQMLANTASCALLVASTALLYSSSGALPLWDLMQQVLLGWAAPTVLLYLWETEDRLRYLQGLEAQRNKVADCQPSKCKHM